MSSRIAAFTIFVSISTNAAFGQTPADFTTLLRGGKPTAQPSQPAPTRAEPGVSAPLGKARLRDIGTASSVFILVSRSTGLASGTGFIIAPDLVMTNAHLAEGADEILVVASDRSRHPAKLLALSRPSSVGDRDFAVVKLDGSLDVPIPPFSSQYKPLDDVVAFGFPGKVTANDRQFREMFGGDKRAMPSVVVSSGIIQNVIENELHVETLTHSAKISSGNSGGPLFDVCGRIVGINTYVASTTVSMTNSQTKSTVDVPQGYQWALATKEMLIFLNSRAIPVATEAGPCQQ